MDQNRAFDLQELIDVTINIITDLKGELLKGRLEFAKQPSSVTLKRIFFPFIAILVLGIANLYAIIHRCFQEEFKHDTTLFFEKLVS